MSDDVSPLSIKPFPAELKQQAKSAAAAQGILFKDWVAAAFEEKLAREGRDPKWKFG